MVCPALVHIYVVNLVFVLPGNTFTTDILHKSVGFAKV